MRDMVTATTWEDAWGSDGTQNLIPSPHIEGISDYANRMTDRIAFLACQQNDTFVSESNNIHHTMVNDANTWRELERWTVYYSGWHPVVWLQGWVGQVYNNPTSYQAAFSVRMVDTIDDYELDFGTLVTEVPYLVGTRVSLYFSIPPAEAMPAGHYRFILAGVPLMSANVLIEGVTFAWIPAEVI